MTPRDERLVPREQFYAERPERVLSRELDFGVMWRREGSRDFAGRVTWIESTGEIYLEHREQIQLLGVIRGEEELERALKGWEHVCNQAGGLSWVRGRISMAEDELRRQRAEEARARRQGNTLARALGSPRR